MTRLRAACAGGAALLALALGVADRLPLRTLRREPAWGQALAPLAGAPLTAGAPAALVVPDRLTTQERNDLLFEACWRRPDVLWELGVPRPHGALRAVVAVGDAAWPAGWREVWHGGSLVVLERARP